MYDQAYFAQLGASEQGRRQEPGHGPQHEGEQTGQSLCSMPLTSQLARKGQSSEPWGHAARSRPNSPMHPLHHCSPTTAIANESGPASASDESRPSCPKGLGWLPKRSSSATGRLLQRPDPRAVLPKHPTDPRCRAQGHLCHPPPAPHPSRPPSRPSSARTEKVAEPGRRRALERCH